MPIPEFNEIKAPALQFFADGAPHKVSEVYSKLAGHFNLTDSEQNEILPSGVQRRWHNRANWACYDLFRAGLLDRPKRGLYVINEAGNDPEGNTRCANDAEAGGPRALAGDGGDNRGHADGPGGEHQTAGERRRQ